MVRASIRTGANHLVSRLRGSKVVELRTPASVKDYVFITDLAEALCIGIEASVTGPVAARARGGECRFNSWRKASRTFWCRSTRGGISDATTT